MPSALPVFPQNNRLLGILSLAALTVLLFFALIFWQERGFFGDAPWISFRVINFGILQIQEHRYGSFITQLFPLLATKAGLPLRTVLFLYSTSFNVFYLGAGIVLFRWRQYQFLFLLALYFTMSFSVGFYWTNNEVHQGMTWLLLAFGWTARDEPRRWLFYSVSLSLFFLALSSHMLLLLAGGCLWMHLVIARMAPFYSKKRSWILAAAVLAIAIWRYYMSKVQGWYDADRLSFINHLHFNKISSILSGKSSLGFWERLPAHYPAFLVLAAGSVLVLILGKRWLALGWHLLSLALFWFFISAAFETFTPWYSESDWASWTMVALIPLAIYGFLIPNQSYTAALIGLAFALRLFHIYQSSTPFRERFQKLSYVVSVLKGRYLDKVAIVVPDEKVLEDSLLLSWPLPVEVMELSGIAGSNPVVSLGLIKDKSLLPATRDTMLIPFGKLPAKDFNPVYFPVDSVDKYTVLPLDSLLHWLD